MARRDPSRQRWSLVRESRPGVYCTNRQIGGLGNVRPRLAFLRPTQLPHGCLSSMCSFLSRTPDFAPQGPAPVGEKSKSILSRTPAETSELSHFISSNLRSWPIGAWSQRLLSDGRPRSTGSRWGSAKRLDHEGELHGRDRAEAAAASAHAAHRRGRRGAAARGLERVSGSRSPVEEGP